MDVDPAAAALVRSARQQLAAACGAVAEADGLLVADLGPGWRSASRVAFDQRVDELRFDLRDALDALQRAAAAAQSALAAGVGCGTGHERGGAVSWDGGMRFSPDGLPLLAGVR